MVAERAADANEVEKTLKKWQDQTPRIASQLVDCEIFKSGNRGCGFRFQNGKVKPLAAQW